MIENAQSELTLPSPLLKSADRIEYLDSLRGLAALSVFYSHYCGAYPLNSILGERSTFEYSIFHIWWDGFAAVSLFFVLSGFVLSRKFLGNSKLGTSSIIGFSVGRVLRIWLPYAVAVGISWICKNNFYYQFSTTPEESSWIHSFWSSPMSAHQVIDEMDLSFRDKPYLFLPQAWTLSVELMLSLLIPVGAMVGQASAILLLGYTVFAIKYLAFSRFTFHFVLGLLIAKYVEKILTLLRSELRQRIVLIVGVILYSVRYSVGSYINIPDGLIWGLSGIGSALIIITSFTSSKLQKALNHRWLTFLGRISYSLYLIHFLILFCVLPPIFNLINGFGYKDKLLVWTFGLIIGSVATIGLAYVFYIFIERYCISLGRKISETVSKAASGLVVTTYRRR